MEFDELKLKICITLGTLSLKLFDHQTCSLHLRNSIIKIVESVNQVHSLPFGTEINKIHETPAGEWKIRKDSRQIWNLIIWKSMLYWLSLFLCLQLNAFYDTKNPNIGMEFESWNDLMNPFYVSWFVIDAYIGVIIKIFFLPQISHVTVFRSVKGKQGLKVFLLLLLFFFCFHGSMRRNHERPNCKIAYNNVPRSFGIVVFRY